MSLHPSELLSMWFLMLVYNAVLVALPYPSQVNKLWYTSLYKFLHAIGLQVRELLKLRNGNGNGSGTAKITREVLARVDAKLEPEKKVGP